MKMNLLDIVVLSAASYSIYKISHNTNSSSSLRGEYDFRFPPMKAENKNMYKLDDAIFRYLEDPVQTVLLQCFPLDYTSPRMVADTDLYERSVSASNATGAPSGWVQFVAVAKPNANLLKSAESMLRFCDSFVMKSGKNIDLSKMRGDAILVGLKY